MILAAMLLATVQHTVVKSGNGSVPSNYKLANLVTWNVPAGSEVEVFVSGYIQNADGSWFNFLNHNSGPVGGLEKHWYSITYPSPDDNRASTVATLNVCLYYRPPGEQWQTVWAEPEKVTVLR